MYTTLADDNYTEKNKSRLYMARRTDLIRTRIKYGPNRLICYSIRFLNFFFLKIYFLTIVYQGVITLLSINVCRDVEFKGQSSSFQEEISHICTFRLD